MTRLVTAKARIMSVVLVGLSFVACHTSTVGPPVVEDPVHEREERDGPATDLMYAIAERGVTGVQSRVERLIRDDDERFIAVFIELLRAAQVGYGPSAGWTSTPKLVDALEALSGKSFGEDWDAWVEWYGETELSSPPGFTGWKGKLLSDLDAGFASFLRDGIPRRIRVEEIQWGGVVVDGIPALDEPMMVPPSKANYLTPSEPVIGVSVNGDARAYPLRILDWHEMANDVIGGVPVSISYCTLCGSAVGYDGRGSGGTTYTFGSSGLLYRSNKLMYDRNTRTLWSQFTGEPVLGALADDNVELDRVPLVISAWQDWLDQHPDTKVLDIDTGYDRPYSLGAAYGDYFESPDTLFPVAERSDLLPTKARVYGFNIKGRARAYPLKRLVRRRVVNDRFGSMPLVIVATRGILDVAARDRPEDAGNAYYEAGGEVRSYDRGKLRFHPSKQPDVVIDQHGAKWRATDDGLLGPGDRALDRITGQLAYWFAWFTHFPLTDVYEKA